MANQLFGDLTDDSLQITGTLSSLGLRGFSAYELAVKNLGYSGTETEWLESLKAKFETEYDGKTVKYKYLSEDEWFELFDVDELLNDSIYLTDALNGKVDKKEGHSLLSDSEIERLATLKNYDDAILRENLEELQNALTRLNNTHTEDTNEINKAIRDITSSISSITKSIKNFEDNYALKSDIPKKVSDLLNDEGYLTEHQDISGKVDKVEGKELSSNDYTTQEKNKLANIEENANYYVLPSDVVHDERYVHTDNNYTNTAKAKVDAIPENPVYTDTVYDDIPVRKLIASLSEKLYTLADTDDTTLDQLSEIVAYIKNNKSLIEGITTSKVSYVDIIDNLVTNVTNKPLSASQGVVLKGLIDTVEGKIPTKMSDLEQDVETGKIDSVSLNGVQQEIDENKNVDIIVASFGSGIEYDEDDETLRMESNGFATNWLDNTLSIPGKGADAKAVGDELNAISEDYNELHNFSNSLNNTKVGYSEVVNGQLLMYSDSTKEHLLATLDFHGFTDAEKEWELIADITVNEDVTSIGVNALEDGSPLALVGVFIKYHVLQSNATGETRMFLYSDTTNTYTRAQGGIRDNSDVYGYHLFRNDHGKSFVECASNTTSHGYCKPVYSNTDNWFDYGIDVVKRISFSTTGSANIVKGSTVKIYGIRA